MCPATYNLTKRCNRQMRLPRSARPHHQQPGFSPDRVIARKSFYHQLGLAQAAIPSGGVRASIGGVAPGFIEVGIVVIEIAVLIALSGMRARSMDSRGAIPVPVQSQGTAQT